jgi:very-short-patch-repair endonuclease
MPTSIDPATISRARKLRRGMTQGERKLWAELREFRRWYGVHVRRQSPIGAYIADFMIHERRIVIEVDGEHHFQPERAIHDRKRDAWLAGQGYTVLRFNTGEIADSFEGCIEEILRELGLMGVEKNSATPQGAQ